MILKLDPSKGLTIADYVVTITGNNFEGNEKYYVKFGEAYSPSVKKTSPTTIEAVPPKLQSVGTVSVFVSSNDQDWTDSCHIRVGETANHLINVGPCSKFEFEGVC